MFVTPVLLLVVVGLNLLLVRQQQIDRAHLVLLHQNGKIPYHIQMFLAKCRRRANKLYVKMNMRCGVTGLSVRF